MTRDMEVKKVKKIEIKEEYLNEGELKEIDVKEEEERRKILRKRCEE